LGIGFAQQEGKTKGWAYLVVLHAGEWGRVVVAERDRASWGLGAVGKN
jgi:hypothetical protein